MFDFSKTCGSGKVTGASKRWALLNAPVVIGLFSLADLENFGTASGTGTNSCRATVLKCGRGGIFDLSFGLALYAVAFHVGGTSLECWIG